MYIDHVSGTVNWGKMMEEHPQFSAGHTNRQLATRWSQLKDELPSGPEILKDESLRAEAVRRATGWLLGVTTEPNGSGKS
mmetsp:Transcript_17717/g.46331  ORF Transcript_17717/g.46331 Transcript_17717/m.46331 type:complete len:80 (+) Transcript_17717:316-555(+)